MFLPILTQHVVIKEKITGRDKCICSSSHLLCYRHLPSHAIHNFFPLYGTGVIHACHPKRAQCHWTRTIVTWSHRIGINFPFLRVFTCGVNYIWKYQKFLFAFRAVSRIWMQLSFFANVLFLAPGDNLDLKCPADCFKLAAFAAGFQGKPKHCRALKAAKRP